MHISKGSYPVTLLPPPRRLVPSLGLGTTWVRQPRSGGCHHPTAATKCNVQPSQATANSVGGKACSSTKGGLLHYIPNTYSIHKVSSLKFAYFQGKLSRYTCFNRFIFQLFVNRDHSCGAVSGTSQTHMPMLRKLISNINLFQLKGQDLALSNDMHVLLQMTSIKSAILITPRGI